MTSEPVMYHGVGRVVFANLVTIAHSIARSKGWHDEERTEADMISHIHSELSGMLEAFGKGEPMSEKLPGVPTTKEEWVDVFLRMFDLAGAKDWSGGELYDIMMKKCDHNRTRPYLHGKLGFRSKEKGI